VKIDEGQQKIKIVRANQFSPSAGTTLGSRNQKTPKKPGIFLFSGT